MKVKQCKVEILIDGQLFPPELVYCLQQENPFPGGHSYNLVISTTNFKKIFPNTQSGHYKNPDWYLSASIFRGVEGLLSIFRTGSEIESVQPKYFLNSIQDLIVLDNEVRLSGICSRVQS